ncbi:MAG TPA: hypothetical protein VIV11_23740 [Kofleriaceae bacterium]
MRVTLLAFLLLLFFAGCGLDTIEHSGTDAAVDAPIDGMGSGSNMAAYEPSPRDGNLELVVIAASVVVVLGPASAMRRRRRAKDEITDSPPFS